MCRTFFPFTDMIPERMHSYTQREQKRHEERLFGFGTPSVCATDALSQPRFEGLGSPSKKHAGGLSEANLQPKKPLLGVD